ncbi:MAG: cytochrome d ubiquinol oxidase subunit II, partial [Cypionkella sp.]
LALGGLVQGITMQDRSFAGGTWDWLTPFSVLTALALLAGYALLGATWLNMKTEGEIQARARGMAKALALVFVGLIGAVSLGTVFVRPEYMDRWFGFPTILFSLTVPILVVAVGWALWTGLRDGRDGRPFLATLGLFVLSYIGLGISFFPHIVPPSLTISAAAAPDKSLAFLLVGALVLIPMILAYTAYSYWVFRGKVRPEDGYH